MLLLDDDDRVSRTASDEEIALVSKLGTVGLNAIDEAILGASDRRWLKVTRVIHDAMDAHGRCMDESMITLYARRIIALVDAGKMEAKGDLYRPRFSEIRVSVQPLQPQLA